MSNIKNISPVYVIHLEKSHDRLDNLIKQFEKHEVDNFTICKAIDGLNLSEHTDIEIEPNPFLLETERACAASHLLAIEHWLNTNDSDYAFFFEDDVSFDLVDMWGEDWDSIYARIPPNHDAVQLSVTRNQWSLDFFKFRKRSISSDWGAVAYIIKRQYAESIVDKYIKNNNGKKHIYNLNVSESILFESNQVYSLPLFIESKNLPSTINRKHIGHKERDYRSCDMVCLYWESMKVEDLFR